MSAAKILFMVVVICGGFGVLLLWIFLSMAFHAYNAEPLLLVIFAISCLAAFGQLFYDKLHHYHTIHLSPYPIITGAISLALLAGCVIEIYGEA